VIVGIGIGASGPRANPFVHAGFDALAADPWLRVVARYDIVHSAPAGGATLARFQNAAALVDTALHLDALLGRLHAIERRAGRVRTVRDAARALDLDILWAAGPPRTTARVVVPHPRLHERSFAREPLAQCFARAGLPLPAAVLDGFLPRREPCPEL